MITYKGQTFKVVICTPAGRQKYLSIFKKHIYRKMTEKLVDAWQLWQNTTNPADIFYLESMEREHPQVKIYRIGEPIETSVYKGINLGNMYSYNALQTHLFFANTHDDDTIYIRFDDDIVWAADDAILKICQARIDNPDAFVIYPNIINSTIWTSWHQENGALSEEAGKVKRYTKADPDYAYLDAFNYSDGRLIDHIHQTFKRRYQEGTLSAYYAPSRVLSDYERFSICCIAWWGKDKVSPGYIEEPQLAYQIAEALQRPNFLCGDALMVHYSYHTQRPYLEATGDTHLKFYEAITY
ncbi:hypothetical protein M0R04_13640 [Candidatus Dojkabacteria bacterium]|jgi:hypothetical protein|nr:hypothetical protein [Candidatus Dojkabacteria bacterium]